MLSFTTSTAAHLLSQYGGIGKENDLVVSIKSFFSVIVHASLHSPCFFFSHTLYYTEISFWHIGHCMITLYYTEIQALPGDQVQVS